MQKPPGSSRLRSRTLTSESGRSAMQAFAGSRFFSPSSSRASATVAARRPMSSAIWRALAISSPFDFAISPFGR